MPRQALGHSAPARSARPDREIAGNSRRTRVTIYVTADRRYTFDCAVGADGRIQTASFSPARTGGQQLAAGAR